MNVNGDFVTDFDVDEAAKAKLRIENDGSPNRGKITADALGGIFYQALLSHVQYGKYDGQPAALLIFNFQFSFRDQTSKRITSASVTLTFEETTGPNVKLPEPRNPKNDPVVVFMSPAQVFGEVSVVQRKPYWNLDVSMKFKQYGADVGPEVGMGQASEYTQDRRMTLIGFSTSDDEHHENNAVVWNINENSLQRSGILHRFPAAVIITLPKGPEHHVRITGLIRPFVAFSINPLRLRQKKDDPVYLDRIKEKGTPIMRGVDFKDKAFPLSDLVTLPTEYQVRNLTFRNYSYRYSR